MPSAGPAHFRGGARGAGPPGVDQPSARRLAQSAAGSAGARRSAMSCYIYQLPAWVLDDLCRNMDTLSEWDWMRFGEWAP